MVKEQTLSLSLGWFWDVACVQVQEKKKNWKGFISPATIKMLSK